MNGWIIKHCYYNELGEITDRHYTIMVEEKNWLGIIRKKVLMETISCAMESYTSSRKFFNEEDAERYLNAYMRNKNPRNKWTEEIVKTISPIFDNSNNNN